MQGPGMTTGKVVASNVNRFEFVTFDETSLKKWNDAKAKLQEFESWVNTNVTDVHAKALVFTKLEEAYMWVGKGIRDDQWNRTLGTQGQRNAS